MTTLNWFERLFGHHHYGGRKSDWNYGLGYIMTVASGSRRWTQCGVCGRKWGLEHRPQVTVSDA